MFCKSGYYFLKEVILKIIKEKKLNNNINIKETSIKENPIKKNDKKLKKNNSTKLIKNKKEQKSKEKYLKIKIRNKAKNNTTINKSYSKLELKKKEKNYINKKISNTKEIPKIKNKIIVNDFEKNNLSYKEAMKFDQRSYCSYYISLIRAKHILFFVLFTSDDYNSLIIKFDLFLLYFALNYFINSLFFNQNTIHRIYKDEGVYNFRFFLLFIILSFLISNALFIIIKFFVLSERNIYEIKKQNNFKKAKKMGEKVQSLLVKKYLCFYFIGMAFLLFLWYYLSSFCAVYQNTQSYVIINTAITFIIFLIYPFFIIIFILKCNRLTIFP